MALTEVVNENPEQEARGDVQFGGERSVSRVNATVKEGPDKASVLVRKISAIEEKLCTLLGRQQRYPTHQRLLLLKIVLTQKEGD